MSIDASMFDFDQMKKEKGADPFAEQKRTYTVDDRFYKLKLDEKKSGAAIIRFLPDSERGMIQQMFKINTTVTNPGAKKRFVNEFSPSTINQPCPFQEKWQELWNAGDKEGAKVFSRNVRYLTNIKVIRDPATPENEGKIFLYEMSRTMQEKIRECLQPSEQDIALGSTPKQLFNPLKGNSFRLVAKLGSNGIVTYDPSGPVDEITSIYDSPEEALQDIKENTYKLSDFLKPESFMTYDELVDKFNWVTGANTQSNDKPKTDSLVAEVNTSTAKESDVQPSEQEAKVEEPKEPEKAKADSIDDLLAGLV